MQKVASGPPGRLKTRRGKRNLFVLAVLTPAFLWFLLYMIIPLIMVIVYSFTNAHMAYGDFRFEGLFQYRKMFTQDPLFWTALGNTVKAALYIVPLTILLSLLLALGLNAMIGKTREVYTFFYFLPAIISMSASSLVWRWLYNQNFGLFNAILRALGLPPQPFLNSSSQALFCLCLIQIWAIFGYYAVVLLAAIRGVDRSLYEAAEIDGANTFQKFWNVTLPCVKNTLLFVCIMSTTTAFMFFTPAKIITNGTPGASTTVLMLHIYNRGVTNSDTAYASAMSLVLMVVILFFSLLQWLLSRERKPRTRHAVPVEKGGVRHG